MQPVLKTFLFSSVFLCGSSALCFSQASPAKYEYGVSGGLMIYQGDLTPEKLGSYRTMKPQISVQLYRILSPVLSARLSLGRGKLAGNDALYKNPDWRQQRNFAFSTPVTELSLQLVYNFLEKTQPRISPYIFAGAGVSRLKVSRDYSNINQEIFSSNTEVMNGLAADIAHRLPRTMIVLPAGAGLRYYLGDRISLLAETAYRFGFTDYIDGFSQAANPAKNDHYLTHSIGLIYSPASRTKGTGCPVMKY